MGRHRITIQSTIRSGSGLLKSNLKLIESGCRPALTPQLIIQPILFSLEYLTKFLFHKMDQVVLDRIWIWVITSKIIADLANWICKCITYVNLFLTGLLSWNRPLLWLHSNAPHRPRSYPHPADRDFFLLLFASFFEVFSAKISSRRFFLQLCRQKDTKTLSKCVKAKSCACL